MPEDAALAYKLVRKQSSLLVNDLRLNVCSLDQRSVTGSLDCVGYFVDKVYSCPGLVWVELKAWGATTFEKNFEKAKADLPLKLVREQRREASLCGVLLVAARVQKSGRTWTEPTLTAVLWSCETEAW